MWEVFQLIYKYIANHVGELFKHQMKWYKHLLISKVKWNNIKIKIKIKIVYIVYNYILKKAYL